MAIARKSLRGLVVGVVLAALIVLYWPHALYVASTIGLTVPPKVGELSVDLINGWFPVYTSESFLARLRRKETDLDKTLFLFRIEGIKPGLAGIMSVRQLSAEATRRQLERPTCGTQNFSFGEVVRVCAQPGTSQLFIVPSVNAGVVADDTRFLNDIVSLRQTLER